MTAKTDDRSRVENRGDLGRQHRGPAESHPNLGRRYHEPAQNHPDLGHPRLDLATMMRHVTEAMIRRVHRKRQQNAHQHLPRPNLNPIAARKNTSPVRSIVKSPRNAAMVHRLTRIQTEMARNRRRRRVKNRKKGERRVAAAAHLHRHKLIVLAD